MGEKEKKGRPNRSEIYKKWRNTMQKNGRKNDKERDRLKGMEAQEREREKEKNR